jgi:3-dehydroquinate synthase
MADAAIGGKNALNFGKMKNAIGSFYLPKKVIINISFLRTLPEEYYFSGLAEIIKIAILKSIELFQLLELNKKELFNRDYDFLEFIIKQAIKLKVDIVNKDFTDKNERLILNFGHTFGHSIELVKNIPHGYAVAEGILYSLLISEKLEIIKKNVNESVLSLLNHYNLLKYWDVKSPVYKLLLHDKKNNFDSIRMILLKDIEQPIIKTFKRDEFSKLVKNLFKY